MRALPAVMASSLLISNFFGCTYRIGNGADDGGDRCGNDGAPLLTVDFFASLDDVLAAVDMFANGREGWRQQQK